MIRLLRDGLTAEAVAAAYGAVPEYVLRLNERFGRHGSVGILTEEDLNAFRGLHPENIRVCSFNLHGTHNEAPGRLRAIAASLSPLDPDLCAFQEALITENGTNTGGDVALWLSRITGSHYRSHFKECHLFMERYPEGVSLASRWPLNSATYIDLTAGLKKGLRPGMERHAAVSEVRVRDMNVLFASVHLDHDGPPGVRLAQTEKLAHELNRLASINDCGLIIAAGDFNDQEDSPAMKHMRKNGFRDAFRECRSDSGYTFTASNPHARIDFIMIKGKAKVLSAELIPEDPGLSDHMGVSAVIAP